MTEKKEDTITDYSIKSWIERSKNPELFKNFNELSDDFAQDQVTDLVYPEYRDNAEVDRLIAGITPQLVRKEKKKRVYNLFYTETCADYDWLDDSNSSIEEEYELPDCRKRKNASEHNGDTNKNTLHLSSGCKRENQEKHTKKQNKDRSNKKQKGVTEALSNGYESFFDDDAMSLTPSPSYYIHKEEDGHPTYISADSQMSLIDFQEETPKKFIMKERKEEANPFYEVDEIYETPAKYLAVENSEVTTPMRYNQLFSDETPRKFLNEKDREQDFVHKEESAKSTKEATSQENIPLILSDNTSEEEKSMQI